MGSRPRPEWTSGNSGCSGNFGPFGRRGTHPLCLRSSLPEPLPCVGPGVLTLRERRLLKEERSGRAERGGPPGPTDFTGPFIFFFREFGEGTNSSLGLSQGTRFRRSYQGSPPIRLRPSPSKSSLLERGLRGGRGDLRRVPVDTPPHVPSGLKVHSLRVEDLCETGVKEDRPLSPTCKVRAWSKISVSLQGVTRSMFR